MNRLSRVLAIIVFPYLAFLALSSCGSGTGDLAGGGTGGTGISTGAITGFGSVIMNGTHFKTDGTVAPGFMTKKFAKGQDRSGGGDTDIFRVGMVVSISHAPGDNNAAEIVYEPNLEGPIDSILPGAGNAVVVLGQTVLLENAAFFTSLNPGNVVEVSGFADPIGRIRATFIERIRPAPMARDTFQIKGFISALNPSGNTFRLGPLPDGSGTPVTVSYSRSAVGAIPSGPSNGMYVQVTTDTQPVGGTITATEVKRLSARTDFPEGATVDLDGLVTKLGSRSGTAFSFDLEGKTVRADVSTVFVGGGETDIRPDVRVQVQGKETGGILTAARVVFR